MATRVVVSLPRRLGGSGRVRGLDPLAVLSQRWDHARCDEEGWRS